MQATDIAVGIVESRDAAGSLVTHLVIENLGSQPLGYSHDNNQDDHQSAYWRLYFSMGLTPCQGETQLSQVLLDGRYGYLEPTEAWLPLAPGESRQIRMENWLFAGNQLVARQGFHITRLDRDEQGNEQEKLLGSPIERSPQLADTRLENPLVHKLSPSCDARPWTPELAYELNHVALGQWAIPDDQQQTVTSQSRLLGSEEAQSQLPIPDDQLHKQSSDSGNPIDNHALGQGISPDDKLVATAQFGMMPDAIKLMTIPNVKHNRCEVDKTMPSHDGNSLDAANLDATTNDTLAVQSNSNNNFNSFPVTGLIISQLACPVEAKYIRSQLVDMGLANDSGTPLELIVDEHKPAASLGINQMTTDDTPSELVADKQKTNTPTKTGMAQVVDFERGGYQLSCKPDAIQIKAASNEGIFYGLQTLMQLLQFHGDEARLPIVEINDQPDLEHRGLFLDIARHFQTPQQIKKLIRVMAIYKLNRLQLGISNDEGWRLEIPGIPELTDCGSQRGFKSTDKGAARLYPAWGDNHEITGGYITRQEFIDLLMFANNHHIEIILEVNLPGHANAIIQSLSNLAQKDTSETEPRVSLLHSIYQRLATAFRIHSSIPQAYRGGLRKDATNQGAGGRLVQGLPKGVSLSAPDHAGSNRYQLIDPEDQSSHCSAQGYRQNVVNPCMPDTWRFLADVLREIKRCYDEADVQMKRIHLGGDEVPEGAWLGSPACQRSAVWQPKWDLDREEDRQAATDSMTSYWFEEVNRVAREVIPGIETGFWHEMSAAAADNETAKTSAETQVNHDSNTVAAKEKAPKTSSAFQSMSDAKNTAAQNESAKTSTAHGQAKIDTMNESLHSWFNVWATEAGQDDIVHGVLARKQRLVIANASYLYFDMPYCLHPAEPGLPWAGYISTRHIYNFDPLAWLGLNQVGSEHSQAPDEEAPGPQASKVDDNVKLNDRDNLQAPTDKAPGHQELRASVHGVMGMQAQLWTETIITPEDMDYHLFPRLLAFAERCWNVKPQHEDWPGFASRVGLHELDRLARHGVHFRIPPPGLLVTNGMVAANTAYPGLEVRYTDDGSVPNDDSLPYTQPVPFSDSLRFCTMHPATGRFSRAISAE